VVRLNTTVATTSYDFLILRRSVYNESQLVIDSLRQLWPRVYKHQRAMHAGYITEAVAPSLVLTE